MNAEDYVFYLVESLDGTAIFNGIRGNIFRCTPDRYDEMMSILPESDHEKITKLHYLDMVQNFNSKVYHHVYYMFLDLRGQKC